MLFVYLRNIAQLLCRVAAQKFISNQISTVTVKSTLEQDTKAQRGSRGTALLLLYLRRLMVGVGGRGPTASLDGYGTPRPHRDSVPAASRYTVNTVKCLSM